MKHSANNSCKIQIHHSLSFRGKHHPHYLRPVCCWTVGVALHKGLRANYGAHKQMHKQRQPQIVFLTLAHSYKMTKIKKVSMKMHFFRNKLLTWRFYRRAGTPRRTLSVQFLHLVKR